MMKTLYLKNETADIFAEYEKKYGGASAAFRVILERYHGIMQEYQTDEKAALLNNQDELRLAVIRAKPDKAVEVVDSYFDDGISYTDAACIADWLEATGNGRQ